MTPIKKLYEVLVLGLVWIPAAVAITFMIEKDITGNDFTVYGLVALIVAITFVATEYILEAVRVDTEYSPD